MCAEPFYTAATTLYSFLYSFSIGSIKKYDTLAYRGGGGGGPNSDEGTETRLVYVYYKPFTIYTKTATYELSRFGHSEISSVLELLSF